MSFSQSKQKFFETVKKGDILIFDARRTFYVVKQSLADEKIAFNKNNPNEFILQRDRGITTALVLEIAWRTDGYIDHPNFLSLVTAPDGELLRGWVHGLHFAGPKPKLKAVKAASVGT